MKELNIDANLTKLRKSRSITQDELAAYIGVSKASVSKWETGQSYPDITFLPMLATYFNISVDELLGYSPQMTIADIQKLYAQFTERFAKESYEDVYQDTQEIVRKYYSCFPLIYYMGVLYLNYSITAPESLKEQMLDQTVSLMSRVEVESDDTYLIKEATLLKSMIHLMRNQPVEVIDALQDNVRPYLGEETLLIQAYAMNSQPERSMSILQFFMYQNLIALLSELDHYLMFATSDPALFEETKKRGLTLIETFHMESLNENQVMKFYFSCAAVHMMQQDKDNCYAMLERFVNVLTHVTFPITFKGDEYFHEVPNMMKEYEIMSTAPRDKETIIKSTINEMANNPVFETIKDETQFKRLIAKMERML